MGHTERIERRERLRVGLWSVAGLAIVALGAAACRPSLDAYAAVRLPAVRPDDGAPRVTVTFLGVATLLIDDGETRLMTDGFFTRPSLWSTLVGRIAPDREVIGRALDRAGIDKLDALFVVHSHYDHAMDAPEVARRTGALLFGSESTANVARGWGLGEDRIHVVHPSEPMRFGRFTVTMIPSHHFPHGMAMGDITAPLVPPACSTDYREGGSFSVLVEHPFGSLLVQGSAGWIDGALAGRHADVVLLGVAGMGGKGEEYMDGYYRNVVDAVGARCVIPIHFDDFTLPLDDALEPLPRLLDDFDGAMAFLLHRTHAGGVGLGLLAPWQPVSLLGPGAVDCAPDPPPAS